MSAKVSHAQISTYTSSHSSTSQPSLGCCFSASLLSQSVGTLGQRKEEVNKGGGGGDEGRYEAQRAVTYPSHTASMWSIRCALHWPREVGQLFGDFFSCLHSINPSQTALKHKQDVNLPPPSRAGFKTSYPQKYNEAVLKIVSNCVQYTGAHSHTVVDKQPNDVWNTSTTAMICCDNCYPPVCSTNKCGIGGQTH